MITIVGDVIVDEYLYGELIGPSSEVVCGRKIRILQKDRKLGGAAAVAALIVAMGERPLLASVRADDDNGGWLALELQQRRVLTEIQRDPARKTTTKTRVLLNNQIQPDRLDYETLDPITEEQTKLISKVHVGDEEGDAVLLIDYGKGVLSDDLCAKLIRRADAKNTPVVVDPALGVPWTRYIGATLIKANRLEASMELGYSGSRWLEPDEMVGALAEKYHCKVIITDGDRGMSWAVYGGDSGHVPAQKSTVVDITGCGDTVAAAVAMRINHQLPDICHFAATEAAKCVGRVGVC